MATLTWIPISSLAAALCAGWVMTEDMPVRLNGVLHVRVYLPGQRVAS